MDISPILTFVGYAIYASLGLAALYGVFCVVLLVRRITQKRFSSGGAAEEFLGDVREGMNKQNFEAVAELCDSPPYWSKAVPQLITIALKNRNRSIPKLRQLLAERFEREVLADLEYGTSWVATIVKSAPMLGLLGTVVGMINAFGKIATMQEAGGAVSKALSNDISFALVTTALGLVVAIPLVLAGAMIQVRIGKLQDAVQQQLAVFLDDLESVNAGKGKR